MTTVTGPSSADVLWRAPDAQRFTNVTTQWSSVAAMFSILPTVDSCMSMLNILAKSRPRLTCKMTIGETCYVVAALLIYNAYNGCKQKPHKTWGRRIPSMTTIAHGMTWSYDVEKAPHPVLHFRRTKYLSSRWRIWYLWPLTRDCPVTKAVVPS